MFKRILIIFSVVVLLILVCGGIVGFNLFRAKAISAYFASAPRPTITVSTQTVKPVTWTPGIDAIGTVSALNGVDLTVEVSGIVKEIRFKANQKVKQGDVLVQLDAQVEQADLDAAKGQSSLDKSALQRAQELLKRGVGSEQTLDSANAAATTSSANAEKLQAVLDQKRLAAPFAGTTGIPRIDLGQYVTPGSTVVTLQDLDTMRADFTVPEQHLGELKIGQTIKLSTNQKDWLYSGTVTGVDPKVDPSSRLVSVRAEVGNTDGKLTPGQFVQTQVQLPIEDNVLAVTQTAVVSSLYGDYVFVVAPPDSKPAGQPTATESDQVASGKPSDSGGYVKKSTDTAAADKPGDANAKTEQAAPPPAEVAKQIFVKAGRRSQGLVEILKGLKPGDVIVTSGQNRLTNGSPVKVDNAVDVTNAPPPQGTQDTSPAP